MAQFTGELVIVSEGALQQARRTGDEFATARAVSQRDEYDRGLRANTTVSTYMGLIAREELIEQLLGVGVGSRVLVTGDLWRDDYTRKDGSPAFDRKLTLASIEMVAPVSDKERRLLDEDADITASLVRAS